MAEKYKNKFDKLANAPIKGLISSIAVPTILSMLVSAFYNMADSFFVGKINTQGVASIGIVFSIMTLLQAIGFFLGTQFKDQITSIDHWIAFVLLGLIGINMVKEALSNDEEQADDSIAVKEMFMLAVATSIDALAVGITFAFLNVHIVSAASMIGVCTFLISFAGVKIGNIFGTKYKSKAELAGGIILILLGFKILLEHLHIL